MMEQSRRFDFRDAPTTLALAIVYGYALSIRCALKYFYSSEEAPAAKCGHAIPKPPKFTLADVTLELDAQIDYRIRHELVKFQVAELLPGTRDEGWRLLSTRLQEVRTRSPPYRKASFAG
jgi:hypothetical protein